MLIKGFQKLTLLDYPGKTACTVFTGGCNYRCPFCHNAGLVTKMDTEIIPESEVFNHLKKRQGILDGVAISGGEPLLQGDIEEPAGVCGVRSRLSWQRVRLGCHIDKNFFLSIRSQCSCKCKHQRYY